MAAGGGSWKGGSFKAASGGGSAGNARRSEQLRSAIASRAPEPVSSFSKGDHFLMGNNIARIESVSGDSFVFRTLNPAGGVGGKTVIDRFASQRLIRVSSSDVGRAQEIAKRAGGGFKAPDIFRGLGRAASAAIDAQKK